MWYEFFLKRGLVPDYILRKAIRYKLRSRIHSDPKSPSQIYDYLKELQYKLDNSPIAVKTSKPNEQHYEVPPSFFKAVLGQNLKYSCCYWSDLTSTDGDPEGLDDAEIKMIELTLKRAGISENMDILDLGCGWGSHTLFIAEKFPNSQITALSNSEVQKAYIQTEIENRGLKNITVINADIAVFNFDKKYDIILSVEMFEHMRNYKSLFSKLTDTLKENGKLFIHIFARSGVPYLFDSSDQSNWMAKYFFSGGTMPNESLLPNSATGLTLEEEWKINGKHYQKTLETWLVNMDTSKDKITKTLEDTYGDDHKMWWHYWRIFFIACAEMFGYEDGKKWFVKHYRFVKK